jgi:hypothetical protein
MPRRLRGMTRRMTNAGRTALKRHLMISGTGRAGTSLLVRWLAAMGLETHLQVHASPSWFNDANAGLEDLPLATAWETAPYVMKSPWLAEIIDTALADFGTAMDGVIIPVRDLLPAAASRVVQEVQSTYRKNLWMTNLRQGYEQWGTTPGGVVFSLDAVDQARLLAVSFHRLVQRLVQADVPIVLLDFPRFARDADYLFRKLHDFLPAGADVGQARQALADVADPAKLRVEGELGESPSAAPTRDALEIIALRREVRRLADALAAAECAVNLAPGGRAERSAEREALLREPDQSPESAASERAEAERRVDSVVGSPAGSEPDGQGN